MLVLINSWRTRPAHPQDHQIYDDHLFIWLLVIPNSSLRSIIAEDFFLTFLAPFMEGV